MAKITVEIEVSDGCKCYDDNKKELCNLYFYSGTDKGECRLHNASIIRFKKCSACLSASKEQRKVNRG